MISPQNHNTSGSLTPSQNDADSQMQGWEAACPIPKSESQIAQKQRLTRNRGLDEGLIRLGQHMKQIARATARE